jgi:hypothetical protein
MVAGVQAPGAGGGVAMGSEHGSVTPDGAHETHIEGGLVFGGRSTQPAWLAETAGIFARPVLGGLHHEYEWAAA